MTIITEKLQAMIVDGRLYLSGTGFSDADSKLLPYLRGLTALSLSRTKVADISTLADCPALTTLRLSGTEVAAAQMAALRAALPNLTIIK